MRKYFILAISLFLIFVIISKAQAAIELSASNINVITEDITYNFAERLGQFFGVQFEDVEKETPSGPITHDPGIRNTEKLPFEKFSNQIYLPLSPANPDLTPKLLQIGKRFVELSETDAFAIVALGPTELSGCRVPSLYVSNAPNIEKSSIMKTAMKEAGFNSYLIRRKYPEVIVHSLGLRLFTTMERCLGPWERLVTVRTSPGGNKATFTLPGHVFLIYKSKKDTGQTPQQEDVCQKYFTPFALQYDENKDGKLNIGEFLKAAKDRKTTINSSGLPKFSIVELKKMLLMVRLKCDIQTSKSQTLRCPAPPPNYCAPAQNAKKVYVAGCHVAWQCDNLLNPKPTR